MTFKQLLTGAIAATTLSAFATISHADTVQEAPEQAQQTTRMYFGLGRASFDDAVVQEGIDTTATSWRFGMERQTGNLLIGGGLSGFLYKDNESFSQDVTSTFGSDSRADSSATAYSLYFEGGYSHSLNDKVSLGLLGGMELVLSSTRGIGNCTNCYEEDIDVSSGLYIQPRINIDINSDWYWGASYNQYLGGDAKNNFMVNVGMTF